MKNNIVSNALALLVISSLSVPLAAAMSGKPVLVPTHVVEGNDDSRTVRLPETGTDGAAVISLSSMEIEKAVNGWGTIRADKSVGGNPILLKDTLYLSGVGTHANARIIVKLNGAVTRFVSRVGIDDEVRAEVAGHEEHSGRCNYRVTLVGEDGRRLTAAEGEISSLDSSAPLIEVDCNGWKYLVLEADEGAGGNVCDHVDWANAYFEYVEQNSTPPIIVSDEEISSDLACATEVFSQPGLRFMHKVRPFAPGATVSVSGLPKGLVWNARRGLVEGIAPAEGDYTYKAAVVNGAESGEEEIHLTVSSGMQQPVPFMGWLSWNVFEMEIDEAKVKAVAEAFDKYGMKDAGYRYLCLDDLWHAAAREEGTGKPLYSKEKFPGGLKSLADLVHSKGLKFGIYSDAAANTCAGAFGSYGYEEVDARQYADWGFDLLKYDYCHAPSDVESAKVRYKAMGDALKASGRDILLYMCEWGVREPWKWAVGTGATTWRCTYDTRDCWEGATGGIGILQSIAGMKDIWAYSGPNRFNDADMMCVGLHGTGKSSNVLCKTKPGMTQAEYRTQFSLWCMWASPLTLSFDVREISDEDLAIITNEELIAINQDPMGQQAEFVGEKDGMQLYVKDLENGDVAIAILNLNDASKDYVLDFDALSALEPGREYAFRDLWEHKPQGIYRKTFSVNVASHETKVYRLTARENLGPKIVQPVAMPLKVSASKGKVVVKCPGTDGMEKRILVSDLRGNVVASARGTAVRFVLPVKASGEHVVTVVGGACARRLGVRL